MAKNKIENNCPLCGKKFIEAIFIKSQFSSFKYDVVIYVHKRWIGTGEFEGCASSRDYRKNGWKK